MFWGRDTVISTILISSIVFSGSGGTVLYNRRYYIAGIWKFMGPAQELLLLSVINTKFASQTLIAVFEGSSFVNFNMFAPLCDLIPAEYTGQVGYNVLEDNAQYHPNIFFIARTYGLR